MFMINGKWAIEEDELQWMLGPVQGRKVAKVYPEWFSRTREGLLLGVRERCGEVDEAVMERLRGLPDHFKAGYLDG